MTITTFIKRLTTLQRQGYGDISIVMMDPVTGLNGKQHQTTVEDYKITKAEWDPEKTVLLLLR